MQTRQLSIEVGRRLVGSHADHVLGGVPEEVAAGIESVIQSVDDVGEPNGVDVEHGCRVGIRS